MLFRINVALILILIFTIIHCEQLCSNGELSYLETDHKAKLSVLLSLREPGTRNTCGAILESQLQLLAAIQWTVERINDRKFLPFKLGYQVYDDCDSDWYTIKGVQAFFGCSMSTAKNECNSLPQQQLPDIGLLGLSRRLDTEEVQELLRQVNIPIVSPFTTGPGASWNVITTRPSLREQARAMVATAKKLNWTYSVAVNSNDKRAISGIQLIRNLAGDEGICVDVLGAIPNGLELNSSATDDIIQRVWKARINAKIETLGLIYFGNGYDGLVFMKHLHEFISDKSEPQPVIVLLPDEVEERLNKVTAIDLIPDHTLIFRPPEVVIREFENTFNSKWTTDPSMFNGSNHLETMIQQFNIEQNRVPSNITNFTRNHLVPLAVDAVFTLTTAYRTAFEDKCGKASDEVCPVLKELTAEDMVLQYVSKVTVPYTSDDSAVPMEFVDAKREIGRSTGFEVYLVNDSNSLQVLRRVGHITGEGSSGYTIDAEFNISLPSSCQGACLGCVSSSPYPYAYIDGDILLLGIFSVHESEPGNNKFECGKFKDYSIKKILHEEFLYGVQRLRDKLNINFGAVVFDACESPPHAVSTVAEFMAGKLIITKPGTTVAIDHRKVRMAVGVNFSGTTIPVAMLLSSLSIPLVSYSSSSPDLDDRLTFPYFLRTVPSDRQQAMAMIKLISEMDWEYVSILYVENNYGKKLLQVFMDLAERAGICVSAPPLPLSEQGTTDEDEDTLILLRRQKPEVVVIFSTEGRTSQLVHTMYRQHERIGYIDKFVFLSSESWGNNSHILNKCNKSCLGSLTLKLSSSNSADTGVKSYLQKRTPGTAQYNPFFQEMWAHHFNCSPDGSYSRLYSKTCGDELRISEEVARQWAADQRTVHLLNAVYAIGDGFSRSIGELCPTALPQNCHALAERPEVLVNAIKETKLKSGDQTFSVFDDDGNGLTGFDILNIQTAEGGKLFYEKVGSFVLNELILQKDEIEFYRGKITAKCDISVCGGNCSKEEPVTSEPPACISEVNLGARGIDVAVTIILSIVCVILLLKIIYDIIIKRRKRKADKASSSLPSIAELSAEIRDKEDHKQPSHISQHSYLDIGSPAESDYNSVRYTRTSLDNARDDSKYLSPTTGSAYSTTNTMYRMKDI